MADQEGNKKTIDDYKADYEYFTGKASEIGRSLAFAGIAIIWIFKISKDNTVQLPTELIIPTLLLVISLSFDLLHYIVAGIIWFIHYKILEKKIKNKKIKAKADYKANPFWPGVIHVIYWLKLISLIVAYFCLFSFLLCKLFNS